MKITLISIGLLLLLGGLAWYEVGGLILGLVVGSTVILLLILAAFALGSWWSGKLMERGAEIALKAQLSDDRRDTIQVQALTGLIKETLKMKGAPANSDPDYPALPFGEVLSVDDTTVEGSFTIAGLEEEADLLPRSGQSAEQLY